LIMLLMIAASIVAAAPSPKLELPLMKLMSSRKAVHWYQCYPKSWSREIKSYCSWFFYIRLSNVFVS
jgi:hypothetical protein